MGTSLGNLMKEIDPTLYNQYVMERYKEGNVRQSHANVTSIMNFEPKFKKKSILDQLLDPVRNTPAETYLRNRKIPESCWDNLYYIDNIEKIEQLSEKYKDRIIGNESRLVIPFIDRSGKLVGVTCRALGDERLRYVTVRVNDDLPMIYGLDKVDITKDIYVTEGPIDSLFLDNAIALAGADADGGITIQHQQCTMIYDNEPRNEHIVSRMITAVDKNFNVCIWPESVREGKDINDLIISGKSASQVQSLIHNNTHSGLTALQNINNWKRI